MLNGEKRMVAFRKVDSVLRAALMAEVDDQPEAYGISPAMWDDMVEGRTAAADVFTPAFSAAADAVIEENNRLRQASAAAARAMAESKMVVGERVRFNNGRLYGSEGQRIVAQQQPDGTIVFNDIDRNITGVLTQRSTYGGADGGGPQVYVPLSPMEVQQQVILRYCSDYRYQNTSIKLEY